MKKKAIAILTTILISIPIFMDTPFAEAHGPNNIVYTPYGTCTSEFYYDSTNSTHNITLGGVTIPQVGPVNLLRYTFTHPYTGTFDLDITISGVLSNIWELMTSNCYLVSVVDETTLRFAVNNAEYCEIAIMPSQYNNRLVFWLENQNLTQVEDTTTAVNDILTHVSYIDGQIQQIHADTTMVRNLLISMSGYTADSSDNIATDMDTLISAITQANTQINNINSKLSTVNVPDYSYKAYWQFNWYLNQGVAIWGDYVNFYPSLRLAYQNGNYNYQAGQYYSASDIFVFISNRTIDDLKFISSSGEQNVNKTTNYRNSDYYYMNSITFNSATTASLSVDSPMIIVPIYLGPKDNIPDQVNRMLYNNYNNTYTRKLEEIKNAINNMSMNVNQLTVNATGITYNVNNTQVNNSVNTYNTDIQNVYNVENDFSTSFNTYNQQFTPDFTETINTIQNVPTVMNDVVVDLYGLPFIKYPLLLTLAGIVLIALLGV